MLRPGEDEIRLDAVAHEGSHGNSAMLDLRVSQKATVVGRCDRKSVLNSEFDQQPNEEDHNSHGGLLAKIVEIATAKSHRIVELNDCKILFSLCVDSCAINHHGTYWG